MRMMNDVVRVRDGLDREKNKTTISNIDESFFVNQSKNPEWDCLLRACQQNNIIEVQKIVREYPSSHSHANPMGQSALHIASFWVHVKCVEILLGYGADVNGMNSFTGATPLHECIQSIHCHAHHRRLLSTEGEQNYRRQRIECIKLLLQADADPYALDTMKRTPIECFVVTYDDNEENDTIVDRIEIEKLFVQSQQTSKIRRSFKYLLTKLGSKEVTIDEIDIIWQEELFPYVDTAGQHRQKHYLQSIRCTQLLDKILSMIQEWIDRVDNDTEMRDNINEIVATKTITTQSDKIAGNDDVGYYLGRIVWMWKKIVAISVYITTINEGGDVDNNGNISPLLAYDTQQNAVKIFGMAILERYGNLYSKRQQQQSSHIIINSLLQDDNILSSWTEAIIVFMTEEKITFNKAATTTITITYNDGDGDDSDDDDDDDDDDENNNNNNNNNSIKQTQLQQAWMTIARRNYLELAQFWWKTLRISPIGIINRQGMTPLQFASRSGHLHFVEWLLRNDDEKGNDNSNNISQLYDWVQDQDQRGQTALMAAAANQHKEIVQFLQDFRQEKCSSSSSSSSSLSR